MKAQLLRMLWGVALLLLVPSISFAQTGTITGTVTDSLTAESLPGANVVIAERAQGTATNVDGQFTLEDVPTGSYTLSVTFVGYAAKNVPIEVTSGTNVVDIALRPAAYGLDAVVVTAMGEQRQARSLGYAAQSVSSEDLMRAQESTNFVNNLQGKVAGANITQSSGSVGSSTSIILRGYNSISGNNQPVFIIDGVFIDNSNFNPAGEFGVTGDYESTSDYGNAAMDINPNDIESITVLKGPNAAALYGSRAANGAIIITTKDGTRSREGLGVSVNSSTQFSMVSRLPEM